MEYIKALQTHQSDMTLNKWLSDTSLHMDELLIRADT